MHRRGKYRSNRKSIHSQRGITSLVFVVLVSLALSASIVSDRQSMRSSQQYNIASNTATHLDNGLWVGAENFRQYLNELNADSSVNQLNYTNQLPVSLSSFGIGSISFNDISVTNAPPPAVPLASLCVGFSNNSNCKCESQYQ